LHPLKQLMYPTSIALWGASDNPLKMGTMQMANILETAYEGKVYPVHPRLDTVLGIPAVRSVADIDGPVDLAFLVLPTEVVPGVLEECGQAGIRRAVIISGGFREAAGARGRDLEKQILEIARRHGIRFLGPNCVGIFNGVCHLNTTTIPGPPAGPGIALASQSGAYTAMIYPLLKAHGMKICQTLSVGNEADIDLADCLEYLKDEPEVKAIGLYVETVRRPREFVRAARETVKSKPVVAIYVGGTEAGSRSALSHTGALSGPDGVYDGLFRQAGIIRAEDMDEMLDFLWMLSLQPPAAGPRMAVITNSGGPGSSLAYHAEHAGLVVPRFSDKLTAELDAITGRLAFTGNPIDLTFDTNIFLFKQLVETVFESDEVDGAFVYGIMGSDFMVNLEKRFPQITHGRAVWQEQYTEFLREFSVISRSYGKPLTLMSFLGPASDAIGPLIDLGVPVFPGARRAARAMRALHDYGRIRESL